MLNSKILGLIWLGTPFSIVPVRRQWSKREIKSLKTQAFNFDVQTFFPILHSFVLKIPFLDYLILSPVRNDSWLLKMAFLVICIWRQDRTVFPAYWILIDQFKFWEHQPALCKDRVSPEIMKNVIFCLDQHAGLFLHNQKWSHFVLNKILVVSFDAGCWRRLFYSTSAR